MGIRAKILKNSNFFSGTFRDRVNSDYDAEKSIFYRHIHKVPEVARGSTQIIPFLRKNRF